MVCDHALKQDVPTFLVAAKTIKRSQTIRIADLPDEKSKRIVRHLRCAEAREISRGNRCSSCCSSCWFEGGDHPSMWINAPHGHRRTSKNRKKESGSCPATREECPATWGPGSIRWMLTLFSTYPPTLTIASDPPSNDENPPVARLQRFFGITSRRSPSITTSTFQQVSKRP